MRLLSRLLIIINSVLLAGLAVILSASHVFESSARLNEALDKAGVYHALSSTVQNQFRSQLESSGVNDPLVMASINKVITPATVEKLLQPTLVSITSWLKGNSTDLPKSTLDLTTLKSDLTSQFSQDLDSSKAATINFEVTKAIPDTIELSPGAQIATDANQAKTKPNSSNDKSLTEIKQAYDRAKSWQLPMIVASCIVMVMLVVTNLRRGRAKITKIAWSFLFAGLSVAVLSYGTPLLMDNAGNSQDSWRVAMALVPTLLADARIYSLGYIVIAAGLAIVGMIFMKKPDKKKR